MFGKALVGLVAVVVIGVGGYMYFAEDTCSNGLPATCPSHSVSVGTCSGEEETSCCSSSSRAASVCCEISEEAPACEVLAVAPREVK